MANEIGKIRTLSQYIAGTKTELYPKTLIEAIENQNGESLQNVMSTTIDLKLNDFVNGNLNQSFVKKGEVYTKSEIDSKFEAIDLSEFVTKGQLNTKADKDHRHDDLYSELGHVHSEYIGRSVLEESMNELKLVILGDVYEDLNTLEKIAYSIGNDVQFSTNIRNEISKKLDITKFEDEMVNYSQTDHTHDRYYDKDLLYTKDEVNDLILNLDFETTLNNYATVDYVKEEVKKIDENLQSNYMSIDDAYEQLSNKVDKENGKQLTTEDFTKEFKSKLENIEDNANYYEHPEYHDVTEIKGLHSVATSGSYIDLEDAPTALSAFENDCNFIDNNILDDKIGKVNESIEGLDEKIGENTYLIQATQGELREEIAQTSNTLSRKIDEIYGDDGSKEELASYSLDSLWALANSLEFNPDFKGYVDDLVRESNSSIIEFKEAINEIYGGENAKDELETYELDSLLKIAASIDNNADFKGYVDEEVLENSYS